MVQTLQQEQPWRIRKEVNGQTLLKKGTAMDRREWTDITEDTNSLVPILPKTGTFMDGRD